MLGLLGIGDGLHELRPSHFLAEATMTTIVTVNSRGGITLPKKLRASLGLTPGSRVAFSLLDNGTVIVRLKRRTLSSLAGVLTREGQPAVSIEEMRR
jgi:AbrB family looped-hinge helix DNA binding protein